jgi:hypothetical protein
MSAVRSRSTSSASGSSERMMMGSSTVSLGFGQHPASKPGQPNDQWILTSGPYPRGS